jgi:hypothetical protein
LFDFIELFKPIFVVVFSYFYCTYSRSSVIFKLPVIYFGNQVIRIEKCFNLSVSSGIVPDLMKIARVIPLFKSGDHRYFQNYRPVSVLPIFSKLLERVVFKRITNYIDKLLILSDHQYGFWKKNIPHLWH